jgi:hypothetical protein
LRETSQMKILIFLSFLLLSLSVSADEVSMRGTLFKKGNAWKIFVESDEVSFKKGVLTLVNIPKHYNKLLIRKSFVEVSGHVEKCDIRQTCFSVRKISPAVLNPLKNK